MQWKTWGFTRMLVQRCALDQHRLILPVSVSKPQFHDSSFAATLSGRQCRALVDTGAQRTVVARSVIAQLGLLRIGHMQFSGLHGPQTHTRYLASLGVWAKRVYKDRSTRDFDAGELTLYSIEEPFEIVDMTDNANFDVILGFDFLKLFSFSFHAASGTFELLVKS